MEPTNVWRESFIMRLQVEVPDESKPQERVLRGQIVHAPSGKAWRFATLEDLTKIIQTFVANTPNGAPINRDGASEC